MRCLLILAVALPASLAAQQQKSSPEKRLQNEIQRTQKVFAEILAHLEEKEQKLIRQKKELEEAAKRTRRELDKAAAYLRTLQQQKEKLAEEIDRKKKMLNEIRTGVERVWAAVKEASQAVFPVDAEKKGGLTSLLDAMWRIWKAGTEARVAKEKVICADGVAREAQVLTVGRIARLWMTQDGRTGIGAVSPESPTHWEDVEVKGELAQQVREVFKALERSDKVIFVPVDASRRVTARGLIEQIGLWEQLRRGGVVMFPIGVVGIVGIVLCVVVGLRLRRRRLDEGTERLRRRLETFRHAGSAKMHEVLSETVDEELVRLERGLGAVAVCATVSPLLGLLGTVVGMIRTFETIAAFGAQDARLLAGGIREALITTEAGLAVAIPLLLLHALLRGRAESLAEKLRERGEHMIQKICA